MTEDDTAADEPYPRSMPAVLAILEPGAVAATAGISVRT